MTKWTEEEANILKELWVDPKNDIEYICNCTYKGREDVYTIFNYLYKNAELYLKRKYKEFKEIKGKEEI